MLRGPQGTLFGRNTNGGAIDIVTRPPAEEFGVQLGAEIGEFERRALHVAADVPFSDQLKTKWLAASDESEGFMPSLSAPMSLGGRDNLLFRADVLWQPGRDGDCHRSSACAVVSATPYDTKSNVARA